MVELDLNPGRFTGSQNAVLPVHTTTIVGREFSMELMVLHTRWAKTLTTFDSKQSFQECL